MNGTQSTVSDCVEYVRRLRSAEESSGRAVTTYGGGTGGHGSSRHRQQSGSGRPGKQVLCFNCQTVGHYARDCPQPRKAGASRSRPVQCHFCDGIGHIISECEAFREFKRNKSGKTAVVAAGGSSKKEASGPSEPEDASTVSLDDHRPVMRMPAPEGDRLPRIYVDVHVGDGTRRLIAAVDSCSTYSLIPMKLANELELDTKPSSAVISAVDGADLAVHGRVECTLERSGSDAVYMPEITAVLQVVGDLSVVQADMIVGVNIIASLGGVDLRFSDGALVGVYFGACESAAVSAAVETETESISAVCSDDKHPLRNVSVSREANGNVELTSDDVVVNWNDADKTWTLSWKWLDGVGPQHPVGSGLGEYPRTKLSPDQEESFTEEVQKWLDNGWLVKHDPAKHGEPQCVLPLPAQPQEPKPTTSVRPCLDYRRLNKCIKSVPGADAPACSDTIRRWRQAGHPADFQLLDISKAYLRVHVAPESQRYQVLVWQGELFVMERMGFGLSVAPKAMDMIVKFVTCDIASVDNYVDDLYVPEEVIGQVQERLKEFGLPTKPAEVAASSRVLGLQLGTKDDGTVTWRRRDGIDLQVPANATKRSVFSWCERALSRYPICKWL